jgi:hypothetical protein
MKNSLIIFSFFVFAFLLYNCEKAETPVDSSESVVLQKVEISVADVEQLYAEVNNPENSGKMIRLNAGTYVLSVNDPSGAPRPNGGRLEFQQDMSLSGVSNNRSAVVIDASGLPNASFLIAFGRTGPIRIGRGENSIEWLTILGNDRAAGGIETDLTGTPTTKIKVAHVVSGGSLRGVDVRNIGATMIGRRIDAEIFDNECFGIVEGIRLVNTNGANQGQIYADLRGNRAHDFYIGLLVNNNRCTSGVVEVKSHGDKFEGNGLGGLIIGGAAATGTSVSNSTTFEAHGSKFINNTGPIDPSFNDAGGLLVLGADAFGPDVTFNNTLTVRFWGTKVSGNQNIDFQAFGSRSLADPPVLGGTNNHAVVELHGVSKQIEVVAIDSSPEDPNNTNTVTVIR